VLLWRKRTEHKPQDNKEAVGEKVYRKRRKKEK
jgi:hypothetical protein